jgi:hypothetical protein
VATKWEARRDREARYAEVESIARSGLSADWQSEQREQALVWAEANGFEAPWLEGSLKKMQREGGVRNLGFDPERKAENADRSTAGVPGYNWKNPERLAPTRRRRYDGPEREVSTVVVRAERRMDTFGGDEDTRARLRAERRADVKAMDRRVAARSRRKA